MTERGLPSVDSATACPFVAFEDDRESRATAPDHRHRCYAELVPSPRAAAHQEAYCLSSAFPVCPTFQDWARREAAHARGEGDRPRTAPMAQPETAEQAAAAAARTEPEPEGGTERPRQYPIDEPPVRRNPPRDWAAPPPWAPGGAGSAADAARRAATGDAAATPRFLADRVDESRGLAGSAADRLAAGASATRPGGGAPSRFDPASSADPDEELAGLVTARPIVERPAHDHPLPIPGARRPTVSSSRNTRRDREREREREAIVGPSWEHARRYEAYPTIKTRAGLPSLPRLVVLTAALAIAAVALFFLPALLGVGGDNESPTARPSASLAAPSASVAPTATPAPSAEVYVVKANDTLSGIATEFGLTLDELLAANPQITDPDKVAIGDEITIPARPPEEFTDPSAEPS